MTKNTDNIRFSTILEALPDTVPFVAPEELERHSGRSFSARVGANESAFGLSPLAEKALHEAIGVQGCSWYGDPKSYNLKQLLSERLGVLPEQLCVDSGIDSLLGLTARLFLDAGDVMVTSKGAYPTVNFHAKGVGGVIHTVPYRDHHEDPEALAQAAIENNARLVYLANPDNPMGTQLDPSDIQTLIDALPTQCVLMLDEAYCEFMSREQSLAIDTRQTNVIRFRTFSKAYGMAGMRIGYAIGNASIIRGYDKIRNHFGVTKLAQIAAEASLKDEHMLPGVQREAEVGRQRIYAMARASGLPYIESFTNFVAVDLISSDRAGKMLTLLAENGIFMRKPMSAPQDRFLRVGIGTKAEHAVLENVFAKLLKLL